METQQKISVLYSNEVVNDLNILPAKIKEDVAINVCKSTHELKSKLYCLDKKENIWEYRTTAKGKQYRLLSFFDVETDTYIITSLLIAESKNKTSKAEIDKTNSIRDEYLKDKNAISDKLCTEDDALDVLIGKKGSGERRSFDIKLMTESMNSLNSMLRLGTVSWT